MPVVLFNEDTYLKLFLIVILHRPRQTYTVGLL